jgi:hypothetical protein
MRQRVLSEIRDQEDGMMCSMNWLEFADQKQRFDIGGAARTPRMRPF